MKTSVIGSLQVFFLARPPVVTFILSVAAISVSIFLVALNIRSKDLILDLQAQEDWESFMNHLNEQTLCITTSSSQEPRGKEPDPSVLTTKMWNATGFAAMVHLSDTQWLNPFLTRNLTFVGEGIINLKGWKKSCHHISNIVATTSYLQDSVAFSLIMNSSSLDTKNVSACVYFSGSSDLAPAAMTYHPVLSKQCPSLSSFGKEIGKVYPYDTVNHQSDRSTNKSTCKGGNTVLLSYDSTVLKPKRYLSEVDKMRIFSNLLVAGYLSLGAVSILLLIAVIQGRNLVLTSQHSLLPTKETIC